MKKWTFIALVAANLACMSKKHPEEVIEITDYECTPTREFVTTMNYLRQNPHLSLQGKPAEDVALAVASGCRDAAKRFIVAAEMLAQAGLQGEPTIETAVEIAQADDDQAEAFSRTFKKAFLPAGLDMKMSDAIRLAKSLSLGIKGKLQHVVTDFEELATFCTQARNLDLPKPQCGEIAARLAVKGQNVEGGVAESFVDTLEFMTTAKEGPQLPLFRAFKLSEELAMISPAALDNYVQAYKWATSASGMKLSRKDATDLATRVAVRTAQKRQVLVH